MKNIVIVVTLSFLTFSKQSLSISYNLLKAIKLRLSIKKK